MASPRPGTLDTTVLPRIHLYKVRKKFRLILRLNAKPRIGYFYFKPYLIAFPLFLRDGNADISFNGVLYRVGQQVE